MDDKKEILREVQTLANAFEKLQHYNEEQSKKTTIEDFKIRHEGSAAAYEAAKECMEEILENWGEKGGVQIEAETDLLLCGQGQVFKRRHYKV